MNKESQKGELPKSGSITLKDVAKLAGVTHSTVSRAINHPERVREETLAVIHKAIKELEYKPNPFARGLQTSFSRTVALIVPNIQNLAFANIACGVQKTLDEKHYSMIIASSSEKRERERQICKNLSEQWVDGVIFASSTGGPPPVELLRPSTAKVLIERVVTGQKLDAFFLDIDNGVRQIVEHLHALGHVRIAIILGDRGSLSSKQRLYAFRQSMDAFGLSFPEEYIQTANWTPGGGWGAMEQLLQLREPPTAVFVTTDTMALGVIGAIAAHGLSVPHDISVVGFNNEPGSGEFNPPLTTLDASSYDIGVQAAEVLLKRIEDPKRPPIEIMYPLQLIQRASTGPVLV